MNKVTVNKQQNAESQDKGMGPGLLVAWSAPRRGEGMNFGPVPALCPPCQHHRRAWWGHFWKSHFG